MTATEAAPRPADGTPPAARPRRPSLLRAELHRVSARRFVRVLLALLAVGYLVAAAVTATQFAQPTPELLADAEARMAEEVANADRFRAECVAADPSLSPQEAEAMCGPPASEQDFDADWFLDRQPFRLDADGPAGVTAVAMAVAAVAYVVGATYVGAEWSTRSMVALLSWEPRRLRVMAVKIGVTALVAAAVAVLAQAAWLGTAVLLARYRGTGETPAGFWGDSAAHQGRAVVLAVLVALLGFGLAHLLRNTGAALGIGFVYFAVVETAVRIVWPGGQAFLVTDNVLGLLLPGGWSIVLPAADPADPAGVVAVTGREVLLSNARGGLTVAAYCLVLLAVGSWSFRRRDLH